MSEEHTRLTTFWTGKEAGEIIDFLDQLRDALWSSYHEQILAYDVLVRIEQFEDGPLWCDNDAAPEDPRCELQRELDFDGARFEDGPFDDEPF